MRKLYIALSMAILTTGLISTTSYAADNNITTKRFNGGQAIVINTNTKSTEDVKNILNNLKNNYNLNCNDGSVIKHVSGKLSKVKTSSDKNTSTTAQSKAKKTTEKASTTTPSTATKTTEKASTTTNNKETQKPSTSATQKPATQKPTTTTPTTDNKATNNSSNLSYIEQVVKLVNEERAKAGLSAVTIDTNLAKAADVRAKEIKQSFSHTRPNGSNFSTVLAENNVKYMGGGENIAYGQKTPEEVMNGWMNSSGHRANILNSKFTSIGVGLYQINGVNYWVQLFSY